MCKGNTILFLKTSMDNMEKIPSYFLFVLSCFRVELGYLQGELAGCGGLLTQQSGQISSPDFDGDGYYENNAYCSWEIVASENKLIQFQVLSMSIEESAFCYSFDYLEIWDGVLFKGVYCGSSQLPVDFTSESRVVLVIFKSDDSETDMGFIATFNQIDDMTCGYTVSYRTGLIGTSDVNVNGFYPDVNCTWVITSYDNATVVDLLILSMDIQDQDNCKHNRLKVYDNDTIVGQYCGSSLPQLIRSTTHVLYLHLTSTASFEEAQFTARYLITGSKTLECTVSLYQTSTAPLSGQDESCGGILTDATGILTSPDKNKDGLYDEGVDCAWLIAAPENKVIEIDFAYMETEADGCLYDFIEFYNTNLRLDVRITKVCGSNIDLFSDFHSPSNELVVRFVSDTYYSLRGFSLTYRFAGIVAEQNATKDYGQDTSTESFGKGTASVETVPDRSTNTGVSLTTAETTVSSAVSEKMPVIQGCGNLIRYQSATLLGPDPDLHDKYDVKVHCVWEIQAAENKVIQLRVDWIDIEPNFYCPLEYLRIQDGIFHRGTYCGLQPEDFISESRVVTLEYYAAFGLKRVAFQATYSQINDSTCGFTVEYRAGVFGSQGVNENGYFENMLDLCIWRIDSGNDRFVSRLLVLHMNITCDNSLEVLDFIQTSIGKYCGSAAPSMITSSVIYVRLAFNGRKINFEDAQFSAAYISGVESCGGILLNKTGTVVSPDENQDGIYENEMDCAWLIVAPEDINIEFEFTYMDIRYGKGCNYDFIEFYDKSLKFYSNLFHFCGTDTPSVFTSPSNKLVIRFVSDYYTGASGFSATYRFLGPSTPVISRQTPTQELGTLWSMENGSLSTKDVGRLSTVDTRTGDTNVATDTTMWPGNGSMEESRSDIITVQCILFFTTSVICFLSAGL